MYSIDQDHKNHVWQDSNLVMALVDGTCVLCEINRLNARVDELLGANTREVEKRREAEQWLDTIQCEQKEWALSNFGIQDWFEPMTGVTEEVGELAHALLKQHQKIRGTFSEHELEAQDAIGDIIIYLLNLCNVKGWNLSKIIRDTWTKVVKKRNWKENSVDGSENFFYKREILFQCSKCINGVRKEVGVEEEIPKCCGFPMINMGEMNTKLLKTSGD